ncbi:MAG: xanthine dehydrogenase family protein subunit M [Gammaproteobacteria bacterium]|nr:xanthine dehydrogenase family protein subunit M [Gammaproteobacteria bacterium]
MPSASTYSRPSSLDEALTFIQSTSGKALKILAGGTDLLIQMRAGLYPDTALLDIKNIPETMSITIEPNQVRIGAAAAASEICANIQLRQLYPGLVEGIEYIGSTQIQSRATFGGNLCNASPAADGVPALIAAGGTCLIVGPEGRRINPISTICTGPGETALGQGEFIAEFILPIPKPGSADAYLRFTPRNEMDIAVVGVAANLSVDADGTCTRAQVVIGAIAPTALVASDVAACLVDQPLTPKIIDKAGEIASQLGSPLTDKRGTSEYRHQIAGVLTKRAIKIAAERAKKAH